MVVAVALTIWGVGVLTDAFANPAFSAFWVIGHDEAKSGSIAAIGIAIALIVVFVVAIQLYRRRHGVALKSLSNPT